MGVASLILGIISVVVSVFSFGIYGWTGAILGIIGIILGSLGRKDYKTHAVATAGFVLSIIGTVLSLILYIACIACVGGAAAIFG